MTTPLTMLHDAIWDCLEASQAFLSLFPPGSRRQVRYLTDNDELNPDPDHAELQDADYPRCRVVLAGCRPIINHDTCKSVLEAVYAVEISTGTITQRRLFDAVWAVFCGSANWFEVLRESLEWDGRKFVMSLRVMPFEHQDKNQEQNRSTKQWTSICHVVVGMAFKTLALKTV